MQSIASFTSRARIVAGRRLMSTTTQSQSTKLNRNAALAAAAGLGVMLFVGSTSQQQVLTAPTFVPTVAPPATEEDAALLASIDLPEQPGALADFLVAGAVNRAFVFCKPHAANDNVDALVKQRFGEKNVQIVKEGVLTHDVIDSEKLIDTHYGAIASKAVILKPSELNVPAKGKAEFQKRFGMTWEEAIAKGVVYNAKDGAEKLGVDGDGLEKLWATLDRNTTMIKFGGGFYCGKLGDIFVMNGFYMSMRGKYCQAPAQIKYYLVEWDASEMNWESFRGELLGATDPTQAAPGSLRREIYENWEKLGLAALPDTGDNGLHASASPFEALAERVNWVGADIKSDAFAKGLLAVGVSEETIKVWMTDAQVAYKGAKASIFDLLEDTNGQECLVKAAVISAEQ